MNRHSDEALIASLVDRWSETHNPAAATTCVAEHAALGNTKHIVDVLVVSQRNQTAAIYTATLTVRDASIAGTIRAQIEFTTAVGLTDRFSEAVKIPGLRGSAVSVSFAPPAASVTQKIAIAGYSEQTSY